MPKAEPNPDTNIESVMSNCLHCGQPVVSVKLDAGSVWSDWAHALTGKQECATGAPSPPGTVERAN